jgi:diguanylate cyclase (GGDEF)-like protein/PAS domain S-box-containing protein
MSYIDGGRAEETTEHLPDQSPAAPWSTPPGRTRNRVSVKLNPSLLAYLMGPAAFVTILVLMHFGLVVRQPIWLWALVFVAIPLSNLVVDGVYHHYPGWTGLNLRIAVQAAAVTVVIYLTGWGSVLTMAYAFLAIENVAHDGSRVWRLTAVWSLVSITIAQVYITQGWVPIVLTITQSNALAGMGAFVLVFIVRMAGVTMEQKEDAESSLRLSEDRFRSLIQNSSDATIVIDKTGILAYASPAVVQLFGLHPDEMAGQPALNFVHPDDHDRARTVLGDPDEGREGVSLQARMLRKDGTWCDVEAVLTDLRDRPSVGGFVANVRDITERKEFEALLAHRALHDPLTGLANRQLILDRAEQMLIRSRRVCDPVAAYFIDLDNFKDANDSLGHEAGDKLLKAVADRFTRLLRASDTVGRIGGDEFVILTEGVALIGGPLTVADRIRESLRTPFEVEGFEGMPITVTASIGIATGDRNSALELLRDADIALYRAKAAGRDCAVLFEPAMQSAALDRLELKSDLGTALAAGQFFLLYQPIFDLHSVNLQGVEALLRWQHPTRGVIPPNDFIPVLEDYGMIVDVGRWVLEEACAQAARWQRQGHRITMSVNASMRQLETDSFVGDVKAALARNTLEPTSLVIEVTESTLMRDANATVARLRRLKEIGVMLAIDDFGTGYSSLAYLRQFPVDVLKIDRSFVAEMDGSHDSAALVHTLVELGRTLGLTTLAEGIEDDSQLEILRAERCQSGQGFFFSRPVDPASIEALLAPSRPRSVPTPH